MISVKEQQEMMREETSKLGDADLMDLKDAPLLFSDRPEWDAWFITMCFLVAQRSLDKHTKCGCVVVGDAKEVLSVGYNSPPRGCDDEKIPLERPAKYLFMEHAESNAINNAARCGMRLEGSTFYITGPPCNECFRRIINAGARKIVQGPIVHTSISQEEIDAIRLMNDRGENSIEIVKFKDSDRVFRILSTVQS